MRVLVTGAAGFVGTALVAALEAEHWVRCVDVRPIPPPAQGEYTAADLVHYENVVSACQGMEAVVHLAFVHPGSPVAYPSPDIPMIGTVLPTANLFEAAQQAGIERFVLMSSGAVVTGYSRDTYIHVGLPHFFRGLYPLSKSLQERIAEQYAVEYGTTVVSLRPWSVVDGRLSQHKHGEPLRRDDPSFFGYICRYDLAEACRLALTAPLPGFQPFHLMSTDPGRQMFDVDRTERMLGWVPDETFSSL